MNALDLLKEDHLKVWRLIEEIEHTPSHSPELRMSLFQAVKETLAQHELMEEKVLYPVLLNEAKEMILESYEEHHLVDKVLSELEALDVENETWMPKLAVLKTLIQHHVGGEESEVFIQAQTLLSQEQLQELAEKMDEIKREVDHS